MSSPSFEKKTKVNHENANILFVGGNFQPEIWSSREYLQPWGTESEDNMLPTAKCGQINIIIIIIFTTLTNTTIEVHVAEEKKLYQSLAMLFSGIDSLLVLVFFNKKGKIVAYN